MIDRTSRLDGERIPHYEKKWLIFSGQEILCEQAMSTSDSHQKKPSVSPKYDSSGTHQASLRFRIFSSYSTGERWKSSPVNNHPSTSSRANVETEVTLNDLSPFAVSLENEETPHSPLFQRRTNESPSPLSKGAQELLDLSQDDGESERVHHSASSREFPEKSILSSTSSKSTPHFNTGPPLAFVRQKRIDPSQKNALQSEMHGAIDSSINDKTVSPKSSPVTVTSSGCYQPLPVNEKLFYKHQRVLSPSDQLSASRSELKQRKHQQQIEKTVHLIMEEALGLVHNDVSRPQTKDRLFSEQSVLVPSESHPNEERTVKDASQLSSLPRHPTSLETARGGIGTRKLRANESTLSHTSHGSSNGHLSSQRALFRGQEFEPRNKNGIERAMTTSEQHQLSFYSQKGDENAFSDLLFYWIFCHSVSLPEINPSASIQQKDSASDNPTGTDQLVSDSDRTSDERKRTDRDKQTTLPSKPSLDRDAKNNM